MTKGIIPAAGKATRIHGLPKFLLPVPGGYLLERMAARMGVPCYIGANPDNAALLKATCPPNATVYEVNSRAMPETILAARPYVGDEHVLVGMPDTYWTDKYVFDVLRDRLEMKWAICAVALFAVEPVMATRLGVCGVINNTGIPFISSIVDKSATIPDAPYVNAWGAMAWTPEFWQYIHPEDAHMGIAMQRALDAGVRIAAFLASGDYYDNGTPEDYFRCIRELTGVEHAIR